jgi:hypothetical protein
MQYDKLLDEMREALERGEVRPDEVERVLARGRRRRARPGVPGLLRALGALVIFVGTALLYATIYDGLPQEIRVASPFAFPLVALVAALFLHRRGRPAWEVEVAGTVGYVALGVAYLVSGDAAHAGSGYGTLASLSAAAVVIAVGRALEAVRLTSWGLSASLVSFTIFLADYASVSAADNPWLYLAQAGAGVLAGAVLLSRRREAAAGALRSASLLATASAVVGIVNGELALSGWHAILTVAVVATLLGAVLLDVSGLMWIGAVEGLVWLVAIADLVGSSNGWALAVVVLGAGLLGLGVLLGRVRRGSLAASGFRLRH